MARMTREQEVQWSKGWLELHGIDKTEEEIVKHYYQVSGGREWHLALRNGLPYIEWDEDSDSFMEWWVPEFMDAETP